MGGQNTVSMNPQMQPALQTSGRCIALAATGRILSARCPVFGRKTGIYRGFSQTRPPLESILLFPRASARGWVWADLTACFSGHRFVYGPQCYADDEYRGSAIDNVPRKQNELTRSSFSGSQMDHIVVEKGSISRSSVIASLNQTRRIIVSGYVRPGFVASLRHLGPRRIVELGQHLRAWRVSGGT